MHGCLYDVVLNHRVNFIFAFNVEDIRISQLPLIIFNTSLLILNKMYLCPIINVGIKSNIKSIWDYS